MVNVGINGFGRIGRAVLKVLLEKYGDSLKVAGINDLTDSATLAHLFKYDSLYGTYSGAVSSENNKIIINDKVIKVFAEKEPGNIPWDSAGVDIVIECTGHFTHGEKAKGHIDSGARKVIISAPARNEDITLVMGVNEAIYDNSRHNIISNSSCTTNCLAPIVKVLYKQFGIASGVMTTVHSYTNDQNVLDQPHRDLRRARAAALSIIPTSTGAAKAVSLVIPELEGKLSGYALRVPTPTVSFTDFVCEVQRDTSKEEVNSVLKAASQCELKGILGYSEIPLVSADYKGDQRSSIVDGLCTIVAGGHLVKVAAWYDNEYGYSCRLADLTKFIANRL